MFEDLDHLPSAKIMRRMFWRELTTYMTMKLVRSRYVRPIPQSKFRLAQDQYSSYDGSVIAFVIARWKIHKSIYAVECWVLGAAK